MTIYCDSKYLVFPASHHAQPKRIYFHAEGQLVYDFVMPLEYREPDYVFYLNVERFLGKELCITCDADVTMQIRKSNTGISPQESYVGKYRPLAHFTAKRGWLNDPNGLTFYRGKYLMFYQHNPVACTWENMHWGYAVSEDLVHWQENEIALYPDESGTMFSGSAIVDHRNVSGLKRDEHDPILIFYTAAGSTSETSKGKPFTQCLAYSVDGGETFVKYPKNPLIGQIVGGNRDPKVIYHEPTDRYIMAFYLDQHEFMLYASQNLLDWEPLQKLSLPEDGECPDLYPLLLDDDANKEKWVFTAASDRYLVGSFDGQKFIPEGEPGRLNYGNNSYAAQSWSDLPDGRRIRTAFATVVIPGMPFGSCMNVPQEMRLKTVHGQVQLCAQPVNEIENLYEDTQRFDDIAITRSHPFTMKAEGRCLDISLQIEPQKAMELQLFGLTIAYLPETGELACMDKTAPVKLTNGSLDLRIVIDTVYAEIFANQGSVFMGMTYIQDSALDILKIQSSDARIHTLTVSKIQPFWDVSKGASL